MTFKDRVYQIASQIPKGRVTTYGKLAELAGSPGAARAVGMLMKNNPDLKVVPCHRVVAADGKLTGYSAGHGIPTKMEMLKKEGVVFKGDAVDLSASLWKN